MKWVLFLKFNDFPEARPDDTRSSVFQGLIWIRTRVQMVDYRMKRHRDPAYLSPYSHIDKGRRNEKLFYEEKHLIYKTTSTISRSDETYSSS